MTGTDSFFSSISGRGGVGAASRPALLALGCYVASSLILFANSPAYGAEEAAALEEIVVTAQKREQNLADVPVAITAFTSQSLLESGLDDARDLSAITPGFFGVATNSFLETFSIRGISTTDLGFGGDPSVAIYKDHVYQGRTGASLGHFYDMERVEVLKGPQGLLFGRNSGAGTIHLITAKPDPERTGGYAHAGAGERGVIEFDGAINLPLSDNAALRIAAFHAEEDGWIDNLQGGSERGGHENTGGRASIGFTGERASVTATVEYEERQTSGTLYTLIDPVSREPFTGDIWTIDSEVLDTDTDESDLLSLTLLVEYDLGFATFSSITGFKDHDFYYFEDVDGVPDQYINYIQDQSGDYLSQELRLVSDDSGDFSWFLGASAYWEDINADFSSVSDEETTCFYTFGDSCAAIYPYFYGFEWPGGTPDGLVRESGVGRGEYNGWALYGEATYRLNERFDVSLGLRYSYDKKKYAMEAPYGDSYLSPVVLLGFNLPYALEDSENWDDLSPRAVLRYKPNEDLTLYASFTKGFKSGGYDSFAVTGLDPYTFEVIPGVTMLNPFDPEKIYSYEAGLKALLFDGTTQVDIAVFYYDYEDLQLGTFKGTLFEVDNVGTVEGYGVEAQLHSRPNRHVEFRLGVALSDTEADDVSLDTCSGLDFVSDCNGNRLPSHPKETINAGLTLYYPMDPGEWFLGAQYIYVGSWFSDLNNEDVLREPSFNKLDVRAGFSHRNWMVWAYLENATDEQWYGATSDFFEDGTYPISFLQNRPRTVGVRLLYEF